MLKLRKKQRCALSPFLFNILLEIIAEGIKPKKYIKMVQIEKEVNVPVCKWYYTIH